MSSSKHLDNEAPTPSGVYISESQQAPAASQLSSDHEATERIRFGGWETGFCGCCTHVVPNCCMVTFCPCISLAQIANRLGVMSFGVTLGIYLVIELALGCFQSLVFYEVRHAYYHRSWGYDGYHYGGYYSGDYYYGDGYHSSYYSRLYLTPSAKIYTCASSVINLLIFIFVWHLRAKTRERFNIPGSCCCDCCAAFWCSCCSMAQVATHIKSYKPGSCDFGPRDTLPAYIESNATGGSIA